MQIADWVGYCWFLEPAARAPPTPRFDARKVGLLSPMLGQRAGRIYTLLTSIGDWNRGFSVEQALDPTGMPSSGRGG
jgi:hypothetical protein